MDSNVAFAGSTFLCYVPHVIVVQNYGHRGKKSIRQTNMKHRVTVGFTQVNIWFLNLSHIYIGYEIRLLLELS